MTQQEKDTKRYLEEIEKMLFGSKKAKKRFLMEYEKTICESIKESGQAYDYEQLISRFGSPIIIAENYACVFESETIMKIKQEKRRRRMVFFACCLIMLVCLFLAWCIMQESTLCYLGFYTDSAYSPY